MSLSINPVGWWKVDESSGNAADATGNANTLTNTGSTGYVGGVIGNAIDFGASNSTKSLTRSDACGVGTGNASWTFFLNPTTASAGGVVCGYENTNLITRLECRLESSKIVGYRNNGTETRVTAGSTASDGTWYHVVITYDGSNVELWVNNVSQGTSASSGNGSSSDVASTALGCEVGGSGTKQAYSSSKMDLIGLFPGKLTSGDISALYNSGAGFDYPFVAARTDRMLLMF